MVDRERVLVFLDIVDQRIKQVASWVPDDEASFLEDDLTASAVERSLQVAIEALWDAGYIFLRDLRLGLPADEASLPDHLKDGGIRSAEEADLLGDLHGFRNVLVRRYGEIDPKKVYEHAQRAPEDLARLADAFRQALREHQRDP